MQVTLRHRQAGAARFFVDCEIQFSEEEKAIIYQRGLGEAHDPSANRDSPR